MDKSYRILAVVAMNLVILVILACGCKRSESVPIPFRSSRRTLEERFEVRTKSTGAFTIDIWCVYGLTYARGNTELRVRVIRHDSALPFPKTCTINVTVDKGDGKREVFQSQVQLAKPQAKPNLELDVEGFGREKEVDHSPPALDSYVQGESSINHKLPKGHYQVTEKVTLDNGSEVEMAPFTLVVIPDFGGK
jgi:hypothetical protein